VLDRLTRAATRLAGVPVAFVSLVGDTDRTFAGLTAPAGWVTDPRRALPDEAFCRQVVATGAPVVVNTVAGDPLTPGSADPAALDVAAYVGLPLTTADGLTLGAFCAVDTAPRAWTTDEVEGLRDLAAAAVAELEQRLTAAALRESDERFRQIAESVGEVFWLADPAADRVLYVSPAFERVWGLPADAFYADIGAIVPLIHPDDREAALAGFVRMRRQEIDALEYRIVRSDGAIRWVSNRSFPVRDAEGRIYRTAGIAADITERKLAEAARRGDAERFRALGEHASDVVGVLAADGTILYESPAVRRVLGYDPADLVGRSGLEIVHPDDVASAQERLAEVLCAPGASTFVRYRCRHADGGWRTLDAHVWNLLEHGDVGGIVINARDVTERAATERALRESQERLALALQATSLLVWEHTLGDGTIHGGAFATWNEFLAAVHSDDQARVAEVHAQAVEACGEFAVEFRLQVPGRGLRSHYTMGRVLGEGGRATQVVGVRLDVTERVALEARLRQAQKMEAVGQLAGGVAHDFNNLLTVITGNLEFLRADLLAGLPRDHAAHDDLEEIAHAAARARTLVRQLLTFSRQQPVHAERLDVGAAVRRAEGLLRRVIGEEIVLAVDVTGDDASGGPPMVLADAGQLEQVLMNLAVNARDAMLTARHGAAGAGGTLDIEVDTVTLVASETPAWDGVRPGRWVRLRVRDTGHGMDADTQAHAFEPFFTTKPVGSGTGLGLATVFGIVRQASGAVRVDSTPGRGTTVTILLPAAPDGGAPAAPTAAGGSAAATGRATVLLVEDEAPVRATARRMLERRGYTVIEARHGADALLVWSEHRGAIGAVVTDLRMPELGGRELVARLHAERPGLPVVYMSGYADALALPMATRGAHEAFVEKPFTAESLLDALGAAVEAGTPRPAVAGRSPVRDAPGSTGANG
jgi:PAS domain S-box-containing protein